MGVAETVLPKELTSRVETDLAVSREGEEERVTLITLAKGVTVCRREVFRLTRLITALALLSAA